jgi:hypothetical protein
MMLKSNNFKIKIILVAFAFCLALTLSLILIPSAIINANAGQAAAGSAADPLITLSYLNSVLAELDLSGGSSGFPDSCDYSGAYIVLELWRGQRLRAKTDSVELILRPGSEAVIISPHEIMGLADLTSGTELINGDSMPVNHVVLIPRADGRAVSVTSEVAYIMVRGDYEIF